MYQFGEPLDRKDKQRMKLLGYDGSLENRLIRYMIKEIGTINHQLDFYLIDRAIDWTQKLDRISGRSYEREIWRLVNKHRDRLKPLNVKKKDILNVLEILVNNEDYYINSCLIQDGKMSLKEWLRLRRPVKNSSDDYSIAMYNTCPKNPNRVHFVLNANAAAEIAKYNDWKTEYELFDALRRKHWSRALELKSRLGI